MPSRFVSISRQMRVLWRRPSSPKILYTRRTLGLSAPGPAVSETSTSGLLRQSHIVLSSAGHFETSLDPPGAVGVFTEPFDVSPPPPHAAASTSQRTTTPRFIASLLRAAA